MIACRHHARWLYESCKAIAPNDVAASERVGREGKKGRRRWKERKTDEGMRRKRREGREVERRPNKNNVNADR